VYELSILAEAQRYLDWLYHNESEAKKLENVKADAEEGGKTIALPSYES